MIIDLHSTICFSNMLWILLCSINYFILDEGGMWMFSLLRLDLKQSILSLFGFRICSGSEDELPYIP